MWGATLTMHEAQDQTKTGLSSRKALESYTLHRVPHSQAGSPGQRSATLPVWFSLWATHPEKILGTEGIYQESLIKESAPPKRVNVAV